MSLHALIVETGLMSDAPGAEATQLASRLHELAQREGQALALLHKEHGQWHGYRWQDLEAEVSAQAAGLQARGLRAGDRLAVCGPFEPRLLLLALAAKRLGAHVWPVPRRQPATALQRRLLTLDLRHAYVTVRQDVATWSAAGVLDTGPGLLLTARDTAVSTGLWRRESVAHLGRQPRQDALRLPIRPVLAGHVAWAQESTDWAEGLDILLAQWLERGLTLALPETQETTLRDRVEIQPSHLILSPEARLQLQADLAQRLPTAPGWRLALASRVVAQAVRGARAQGFLARRVARSQGLGRLRSLA